jgi:hypothetical protein
LTRGLDLYPIRGKVDMDLDIKPHPRIIRWISESNHYCRTTHGHNEQTANPPMSPTASPPRHQSPKCPIPNPHNPHPLSSSLSLLVNPQANPQVTSHPPTRSPERPGHRPPSTCTAPHVPYQRPDATAPCPRPASTDHRINMILLSLTNKIQT